MSITFGTFTAIALALLGSVLLTQMIILIIICRQKRNQSLTSDIHQIYQQLYALGQNISECHQQLTDIIQLQTDVMPDIHQAYQKANMMIAQGESNATIASQCKLAQGEVEVLKVLKGKSSF